MILTQSYADQLDVCGCCALHVAAAVCINYSSCRISSVRSFKNVAVVERLSADQYTDIC
jgi:hypothetical protein